MGSVKLCCISFKSRAHLEAGVKASGEKGRKFINEASPEILKDEIGATCGKVSLHRI